MEVLLLKILLNAICKSFPYVEIFSNFSRNALLLKIFLNATCKYFLYVEILKLSQKIYNQKYVSTCVHLTVCRFELKTFHLILL